mmetsp:Transcript_8732/g.18817  ORF Transcript_8732/g.18817 Transcript_8732/m.18817 type:complete len:398 (+) Transcript_8732:81-1274(+)
MDAPTQNLISTLLLWLVVFSLTTLPVACFSLSVRGSSPPPPIIACKSTSEVQKAIDIYINPNNVVLELGAQLSDTSIHLCRAVGSYGRAVLVDVKRKEATSGRSHGRNTTLFLKESNDAATTTHDVTAEGDSFVDRSEYHELEQFDQWRELMDGERQYDALVLDVGSMIGNDLYLTALSLATEFIARQQRSRAIIIKSKVLTAFSQRIIHSQRLLDGTVKLPAKDELEKYSNPIIIPCVGVSDYRRTIPLIVQQEDHVIEVGCHYGTTTSILHDAAVINGDDGFCAGVDIGEKIIMNAKKRYPGIIFEVVDAWNTLELIKLKRGYCRIDSSLGYDVVYADIGGLSGAHGLLESITLLDAIGKALEPRCIVIKSLCMKRLASQLIPISKVKKRVCYHK